MAPQPLAYGYMQIRAITGLTESGQAERAIARAAHQEGFALAELFVDRDPNRPGSRLAALVQAATRSGISTVIVSQWPDLGLQPAASAEARRRLQRERGLVVWCAAELLSYTPVPHQPFATGRRPGHPTGRGR